MSLKILCFSTLSTLFCQFDTLLFLIIDNRQYICIKYVCLFNYQDNFALLNGFKMTAISFVTNRTLGSLSNHFKDTAYFP